MSENKRKPGSVLTFEERKIIKKFSRDYSVAEIARMIGVTRHCLYAELKRNNMTLQTYNPDAAQEQADRLDHRFKKRPVV